MYIITTLYYCSRFQFHNEGIRVSALFDFHMKCHNIFNSSILALKVFSLLTLTIIFLYWSATATIKFKSLPTSSTVAFRFGDDGHGNIDFPAISICMDDLGLSRIVRFYEMMGYDCHLWQMPINSNFYEILKYCNFTTTDGERFYRSLTYLFYDYEFFLKYTHCRMLNIK